MQDKKTSNPPTFECWKGLILGREKVTELRSLHGEKFGFVLREMYDRYVTNCRYAEDEMARIPGARNHAFPMHVRD